MIISLESNSLVSNLAKYSVYFLLNLGFRFYISRVPYYTFVICLKFVKKIQIMDIPSLLHSGCLVIR